MEVFCFVTYTILFWNEQWLEISVWLTNEVFQSGLHPMNKCFRRILLKSSVPLYSTTFCKPLSAKFPWTANSKAHLMLCPDENRVELRTGTVVVTVLHVSEAVMISYSSALQLVWVKTRRSFVMRQKKPLSTPIHCNSNPLVVLYTSFYLVQLAMKFMWQQYR